MLKKLIPFVGFIMLFNVHCKNGQKENYVKNCFTLNEAVLRESQKYIKFYRDSYGHVVNELNVFAVSHQMGDFLLIEEANPEWLSKMPLARFEMEGYSINLFSSIRLFVEQQFDDENIKAFKNRVESYKTLATIWDPLIYFYRIENDSLVRCDYYDCFFKELVLPPAKPTIKYQPPEN